MIRAEPTLRNKELRSGLGVVPPDIQVLGAEGRPERIDLGQRQAIRLDISIRVNNQWRLVFRWDGGRGEAQGVYLDDHSYR
jgi:hypothetical protein